MEAIMLHREAVDKLMARYKGDPLNRPTPTQAVSNAVSQFMRKHKNLNFAVAKIYYAKAFSKADSKEVRFMYKNDLVRDGLEKRGDVLDLGRFIDGVLYLLITGNEDHLVAPVEKYLNFEIPKVTVIAPSESVDATVFIKETLSATGADSVAALTH